MRLIPTRRLAVLAFVASGVSLFAGQLPAVRPAMIALDVAIVLAAIVDLLSTLGPAPEIEREAPRILSVGRAHVISLRIANRRRRKLRGELGDDPVEHTNRTGNPGSFELSSFGRDVMRYELTPTRRGSRTFGAVTARWKGPLGLVARQVRIELPATFDVYPDVHAARALELLRRQGRQDARVGSLRVRGGDTEFERLRPYARGDEPRHVDWRATARRDDLIVRQYQAESNQNVVFALDMGRGMRGESQGLAILDHALNAALLAADVALRGGDKAGLIAFDDAPRTYLPPTGGRNGGRKLTRVAYALEAGLAATDYRIASAFLQTQLRSRSLVVVFTNPLDARSARDLSSSLRALLPRHLPLCVLMRDTDVESLAVAPARGQADLYVRAAAAESLTARDALVHSLRGSGVLVLDAPPAAVTPALVNRYLEIKARRLL